MMRLHSVLLSSMLMALAAFAPVSISADGSNVRDHDQLSDMEVRKVHISAPWLSSQALSSSASASSSDTTTGHFSDSLIVMVPETTAGPYPEQLTDYWFTNDMLAAAKAGASANVTKDRVTVLNAIPLALTLNLYAVSNSTNTATPLTGADVFIWQCDCIGVYSSVDISTAPQNHEDTQGQYWLRAYQTSNTAGSVTFNTIIPGWYTPRSLHFHIRVRLSGANNNSFIVTTQLFPSQALTDSIVNLYPYSNDNQPLTPLAWDMVYTSIDGALAKQLILDMSGSTTKGFTSTFNMGIAISQGMEKQLNL